MSQSNYNVTLRGEDGTVFTEECNAGSVEQVFAWAEEQWPEANVLDVFKPEERAHEIYMRAQRAYDDDTYDLY